MFVIDTPFRLTGNMQVWIAYGTETFGRNFRVRRFWMGMPLKRSDVSRFGGVDFDTICFFGDRLTSSRLAADFDDTCSFKRGLEHDFWSVDGVGRD